MRTAHINQLIRSALSLKRQELRTLGLLIGHIALNRHLLWNCEDQLCTACGIRKTAIHILEDCCANMLARCSSSQAYLTQPQPYVKPSTLLQFARTSTKRFLSCVSILTRDTDIANLSVCLSVRNIPVSDENGLTYRHSFLPYGSPIILVLPASNIFTKFRRGHSLRGH